MAMVACADCAYFVVNADPGTGTCRRYAPRAEASDTQDLRSYQAVWPRILAADPGCGDGAAKQP